MKKLQNLLPLLLLIALTMASCSKAVIEEINSTSPNGKRTIKITGTQVAPMDPIKYTVHFQVENLKEEFTGQFQAGSMTPKNVKVDWIGDSNGKIILTRDDDTKIVWDFKLGPDRITAIPTLNEGLFIGR